MTTNFLPNSLRTAICLALLTLLPFSANADDSITLSGNFKLRGVEALNSGTIREDAGLSGVLKVDAAASAWKLHSWLEGGWDGAVKRPSQDRSLFKNYRKVYQDNSPYLEAKELYLSRSSGEIELRAGIQRFAWGRLDEYPANDLLNPWDYSRFLLKPLEDRKIGVPSVSATINRGSWSADLAWIPWAVPYRLPMPNARWSGASGAADLSQAPGVVLTPAEPVLPDRTAANSSIGIRLRRTGDLEYSLNIFHGYDPKPVFTSTALVIAPQLDRIVIDPGYVPALHRITSLGADAAMVKGDWSLRTEAAYILNRLHNIRRELWGYPMIAAPSIFPLAPIEQIHDSLDYGIGADYRLFEDALLTLQAQQTLILGNVDLLYERKVETLVWWNVKVGWMNQKIETNLNLAYNPEHGDRLSKASAWYIFSDTLKAGVTAVNLQGPPQSIFGRYAQNDEIDAELIYSW